MASILYWDGISMVNCADFENHKELIKKLLSGDTKGADVDLKRANHTRIYSARINDADRLLFTTVNRKLLLLEVILNHDYQKSRFLKPGVAKAFTKKHHAEIDKSIGIDDFLQEDPNKLDVDLIGTHDQSLVFQAVSRYNEQFIHLSEEQFQALYAPFPMLIIGPPGSGKSLLAVELLNQATRTSIDDSELPIACVCFSAGVRDHLRLQWQQGNLGIELLTPIVFLTYNELVQEILHPTPSIDAEPLRFVNKFHCYAFIAAHQDILARLVKSKCFDACDDFLNSNCDLIYQEFYLISALTLDEYLSKGERETLFTSVGDRKAVFDTLAKYHQHLVEEGAIHAAFARLPTEVIKFQKMVVDEAQDFSLLQLQQLFNITKKHQMACAMDPHQSLTVSHSLRSDLQQLLMRSGKSVSTYQLTTTQRCPTIVAKLANRVLVLKNVLFDGVEDKRGLTQIDISDNRKTGSIVWQDVEPTIDNVVNEIDQACQRHGLKKSQVALIVPDDKLAEFERRDDIDLVFSVSSIKGLEYPCVIMLAPCRDLAALHHHLPKNDEGVLTIKKTRSKKGSPQKTVVQHLSRHFAVALNGLFVSLTRASQHLIVFQDDSNKHLTRLIHQLKSVLREEQAPMASENHIAAAIPLSQEASFEDWQKGCIELYSVGNITAASRIYTHHLQKETHLSFDVFIHNYYQNTKDKVIADTMPTSTKRRDIGSVEESVSIRALSVTDETKGKNEISADVYKDMASKDVQRPGLSMSLTQDVSIAEQRYSNSSALQDKKEKKIFLNLFLAQGVSKSLLERLCQSNVFIEVLFFAQPKLFSNCYSCLFYFILDEKVRTDEFYEILQKEKNEKIKNKVVKALVSFYKNLVKDENQRYSVGKNINLALGAVFLLDKLESYVNQRVDAIFVSRLGHSYKDWIDFLYAYKVFDLCVQQRPDLLKDLDLQSALHESQFGGSVFYELCCDLKNNQNVLSENFDLFKEYITPERLNAVSSWTYNMTPLYQLLSSERGLDLMINHWSFFKYILTKEGLNKKISGIELFDNRTPLMQLMATEKGLKLIKNQWPFFKGLIDIEELITPRKMKVLLKHGEQFFDAELPLFHCFQSVAGIELIEADVDFFIEPLTPSLFLHQVKQEAGIAIGSCFYALCLNEHGYKFMVKHWYQYFKKLVPVSALATQSAKFLCGELWSLGYGVGMVHACEERFEEVYAYPNRMYLASYVNKDLFFKSWREDENNNFMAQPMANGKSAFVNLNELAHFNVETFKGYNSVLLSMLNQTYEHELLTKVSDTTDEQLVLWYHLACCLDLNAEHACSIERLLHLHQRLNLIGVNFIGVIMQHVPCQALINQHLFSLVSILTAEGDVAVYHQFWPYFKSHLLSLNVEYQYEQFKRALCNENGAQLLAQSFHEFNGVCAEPLYTLMSTSLGFNALCRFSLEILPFMTKKQLHEQHPFYGNSAFDELCRTYLGYQFIAKYWDFFKDKIDECHIQDKYTHDGCDGEIQIKNPRFVYLKDMLANHGLHLPSASVPPSKSAKKRQRKKAAKEACGKVSELGIFSSSATAFTLGQTQHLPNETKEVTLSIKASASI